MATTKELISNFVKNTAQQLTRPFRDTANFLNPGNIVKNYGGAVTAPTVAPFAAIPTGQQPDIFDLSRALATTPYNIGKSVGKASVSVGKTLPKVPEALSATKELLTTPYGQSYLAKLGFNPQQNISDFISASRNLLPEVESLSDEANRIEDLDIRRAVQLGLGQLRTGALAVSGARDVPLGLYQVAKGDIKGGLGRTAVGGLELAGAAFRTTPFGQATTLGENVLFENLKNQIAGKRGEPITFEGSAKDWFLSDALGIREDHPLAGTAMDIIVNLALGKGEDRIADVLSKTDITASLSRALNNNDIDSFTRILQSEVGGGSLDAYNLSKAQPEDLNKIVSGAPLRDLREFERAVNIGDMDTATKLASKYPNDSRFNTKFLTGGVTKESGFIDFGAEVGKKSDDVVYSREFQAEVRAKSDFAEAEELASRDANVMSEMEKIKDKNGFVKWWDSKFNMLNNTPDRFKKTVSKYLSDGFESRQRQREILGKYQSVDPETGWKVTQLVEDPTLSKAKKLGMTADEYKIWKPKLAEIRKFYDDTRNEAIQKGIEVGYIDNYVNQKWVETPGQVEELIARGTGTKPNFANPRSVGSYEEGLSLGLTPKNTHIAKIMADYRNQLDRAVSNAEFFDNLKKMGYVVEADIAPRGWSYVEGPFVPTGIKAPDEVADVLNVMFGKQDGSFIWDLSSRLSGNIQNLTLAGGVPGKPLNAFVIGQAIKDATALKFKPMFKAITSGWTNDGAKAYFVEPENIKMSELMAQRGINLSTSVERSNNFRNVLMEQDLGAKASDTFHELVDNPTFQRYYPIAQVETFKGVYKSAIKKGMNEDAAADLAAKSLKAWYGIESDVIRTSDFQDKLGTIFFAPRYREAMVNFWKNNVESVSTKLGDPAYSLNRRFVAGTFASYMIMNSLNKMFTGRYMHENPQGKEFTMLVPDGDGGYIGVPLLPSVGTIPRMVGVMINDVLKGDFKHASLESRKSLSMLIKPFVDVVANEDYFGREIYDQDLDTGLDKYKKILTYLTRSFSGHPYISATWRYLNGEVSLYQAISMGLEAPLRFYKPGSIEKGLFYDEYYKLKPIAERYKKLYRNDPVAGDKFASEHKDELDRFAVLGAIQSTYYDMKDTALNNDPYEIFNLARKDANFSSRLPKDIQNSVEVSGNFEDSFRKSIAMDKKTKAIADAFESSDMFIEGGVPINNVIDLAESRGVDPETSLYLAIDRQRNAVKAPIVLELIKSATISGRGEEVVSKMKETGLLTSPLIKEMVSQGLISDAQSSVLEGIGKSSISKKSGTRTTTPAKVSAPSVPSIGRTGGAAGVRSKAGVKTTSFKPIKYSKTALPSPRDAVVSESTLESLRNPLGR